MRTQLGSVWEKRSGFSLLELLIVIVIIGILVGLLFVVLGPTTRTLRVTEVKAEFARMETALASFESEFGTFPPSSILLTEDPSSQAWDPKSQSVLRRMFVPDIDFNAKTDFNDDGDTTDVIQLTSSECLVFFLGGMRTGTTLSGFSRNKEKPFARGGANRIDPFYTLDTARFIDNDGDGMPEYRDLAASDPVAIIYASSNSGQGYQDSDGSVAHYHQSDGATAWNENTYQLISPGADADFGFVSEATPFVMLTWTDGSNVTGAQSDNITNFARGTLGGQ